MAMILAQRTVVGNIVDVFPARKVGAEKHSVVNFTIAITPSVRDGDDWKDGETEFIRCTAWRRLADNVVKSFNKGDRVIAYGRQSMEEEREGKDGEIIPARPNLTVDFVGQEITYDAAHSEREAKNTTTARNEAGDDDDAPKKKKASNPSSKSSKPASKKPEKKKEEDIFDDEDDVFGDDDDDLFD